MFSIKSLVRTVQGWCRRKGGPKPSKRATIALECLDHRQLLAVNFTGIATVDIPATGQPGTVILAADLTNPNTREPQIPSDLLPLIKVSGLAISGERLNYDPSSDVLSIAIDQPDNQKTGMPVLAGDTDNNGDGATVAPDVKVLRPSFLDFGFLGGSETMGVFLDLNDDGIPDVVAGIPNTPGAGKLYQVADAVVNPDPNLAAKTAPTFGTQLLANTGGSFLSNDPLHPSLEFQVTHFSELYQDKTGHALATDSVIGVGSFANSLDDDGISEAFIAAQNANFGVVPPPPHVCPPLEPPILINPHEHRHINTAHPTDIRVNILGSARFDVNEIIPGTVKLGGATPIANFDRHINRDQYEDRTFIFRGSDIKLPRGIINATVTGELTDGTTFESTYQVFNKNYSYYSPAQIKAQEARQAAAGYSATNPPLTPFQQGKAGNLHDLAIEQDHDTQAVQFESAARTSVKIKTKTGSVDARAAAVNVSTPSSTMPAMAVGAAAATKTGYINPVDTGLTVSIPLRPVAQPDSTTTVKIPRKSVTIPDATTTGLPRTKVVRSVATRAFRSGLS